MNSSNVVVDIVSQDPPAPNTAGGGNGSGINARLRAIEDRLTRLETHLGYVAKKEDIQSLKTLIEEKQSTALKWQIGIIFVVLVTFIGVIFKVLPN